MGSDQPNKKISTIIKALELLNSDYYLIRVFSGNIGLNDSNTKFVQNANLSTQGLANLYRIFDILVFPSLFEGFGIPIIEEAMTSSTPDVTSNRGSLP